MRGESVTRLRNAFAQVALALLDEPASTRVPHVFAPPFSSMTADDWRWAVELWRAHAAELLRHVPERPCPACGSSESRFLFFSYDAHPFHECGDCGCWFLPKTIDSAVFERLFERSPEARALAAHMMRERDRGAIRDADLARIGGYLDDLLPLLPPRPGASRRYLDTGCGVGHSLRAGLARGFTVQGVEVDATAVEVARGDGLPVVTPSEPLPPGPYDLLSFWETLEHIADPLGALERFVPYLAPDGLVAITVPNMGSPAARILRESCSWVHGGYNTPGHLNLFHPASLRRLLQRAGLVLLDADGQFSNNPIELAAFLAGETRGAFDALTRQAAPGGLSAPVAAALTEIWPGVSLVERMTLMSPILAVIACRAGSEREFEAAMQRRRERRRAQAAETAAALIATEPDYKGMSEALQREVNERDRMLKELEQHLHAAQDRFNRTLEGRMRARLGPILRKWRR